MLLGKSSHLVVIVENMATAACSNSLVAALLIVVAPVLRGVRGLLPS